MCDRTVGEDSIPKQQIGPAGFENRIEVTRSRATQLSRLLRLHRLRDCPLLQALGRIAARGAKDDLGLGQKK